MENQLLSKGLNNEYYNVSYGKYINTSKLLLVIFSAEYSAKSQGCYSSLSFGKY